MKGRIFLILFDILHSRMVVDAITFFMLSYESVIEILSVLISVIDCAI